MAEARTAPVSTRCYVLDTSVLLSDPWSLTRFDEHEVVLPLVVISELEGKRHHPELGWFARTALRTLDDLRIEHGRLDSPVPIGTAGGTLHVELNHTDPEVLPAGFRTDSNDSRILACALNLAAERRADGRGEVVLVTNLAAAGGVLGGLATGQPVVGRFAVKPTSSILAPRRTIDRDGADTEIATRGRHDPCVGIRAVPVGEAMVACVLADHMLRHRGQIG